MRRKEANANERNRIRQFNAAMARLRQVSSYHLSSGSSLFRKFSQQKIKNIYCDIFPLASIKTMAPGDRAYHSPAPAKGEKSDEGDQFNSVTNPEKTRAAKNTPSVREAYICQLCSFV